MYMTYHFGDQKCKPKQMDQEKFVTPKSWTHSHFNTAVPYLTVAES